MSWLRDMMLPLQGSEYSKQVDDLYMFLVWLSVFFFVLIGGLIFYSVWKFRYKPGVVTPHITDHAVLELTWSVVPLLICIGIFFWGLKGYMNYSVAPGDSLEIQVSGRKWSWAFEYPDGTRSLGEAHIPVNKNVRFVITSEDVLHDFWVPTMRVKHDAIPNRYVSVWFNATKEGEHLVTCAEYCGKDHSKMQAKLFVESEEKYKEWLATGGTEWKNYTPAQWGKLQWEAKGCNSCHNLDGSKNQGPSWKGIWGKTEKFADGGSAVVDENYIRESIYQPQLHIVQGYEPVMPTFQGLVKEPDMRGLIAFIKSMKDQ
ncbi:MAG: cytochrome c oxidase subunit II [Bryobacteraceae bacterium]